jgi:recombination protein RecT
MTEKEIKQAWKQSKMNPVNAEGKIKIDSTHDKFTGEMAKKTVINRACKYIVNTSDDSNLVVRAVKKAELEYTEVEFEADIDGKENAQIIDITTESGELDEAPKVEDKKGGKDDTRKESTGGKEEDQSGLKF